MKAQAFRPSKDDLLAAELARQPDTLPVHPRRRKVRGWRRRMRRLDAWAANEVPDDPTPWLDVGMDAAVRFDMWNISRSFPLLFRRRAVELLVAIHDRWLPYILTVPEPVFLGLSLKLPYVYDSRVLAGTNELGRTWRVWQRPEEGQRVSVPPPSLYNGRPCDLSRFEWTHGLQVYEELSSWQSEVERADLTRDAAHVEEVSNCDLRITRVVHVYRGCLPEILERSG